MEEFQVKARYADGSIGPINIKTQEIEKDGGGVDIHLSNADGLSSQAFSEQSAFSALLEIRKNLDNQGIQLPCLAADRRVFPSPMQESMGYGNLAYRNVLGRQALSSDIVNIYESRDDMECVPVSEQLKFHSKWLSSL